ncbi:MAG: Xaa-Pro peptidase family protein [Anaerolineae bacterium]|nr:Xaa-Pro peptidase family protein [Anaerolineae bacterium]
MTSSSLINARLTRLRDVLSNLGADGLLVSQPEDRYYLSGFSGSSGWLLITQQGAWIATDFRYFEQVAQECPDYTLVKVTTTLGEILPGMLADAGVRRLAFQSDHATFDDVQTWSKAVPEIEWVPTKALVSGLRARKDEHEAAALRAAIALADEAFVAAMGQVRPGMTERELAWIIESYMRTHGAQAASFEIIVAGGPSGAKPHAKPTDAPLVAGQPIVIDMGARLNGYCSDLTRTICLGQPADPDKFWSVYNTVLQAQTAAEAAIRPGMSGPDADAVARQVITEAGYGEFFGHGLGHGVGLAVHELPRLSRISTDTLAPGNFVTVEPGIYLPGWGGVRIEDIVMVTENGVEVLTQAPKEPIILSS